jgi:hypothetical protein
MKITFNLFRIIKFVLICLYLFSGKDPEMVEKRMGGRKKDKKRGKREK